MRAIPILLLACLPAFSATRIYDTLTNANLTLARGNMVITWGAFTKALGGAVAAGQVSLTITNGIVDVTLEDNTSATPTGTSYSVHYYLAPAITYTESWVVPVSATPVLLSAVRVQVAPTPSLTLLLSQLQISGMVKGNLMAFGTGWGAFGPCVNGKVPIADSTKTFGWDCGTPAAGTGTITDINGLPGPSLNIVAGSAGADFTVNPSGSNITLNIPSASASNRGLLTAANWITFNSKLTDIFTTKGQLLARGASAPVVTPIIPNGRYLMGDSSQASGFIDGPGGSGGGSGTPNYPQPFTSQTSVTLLGSVHLLGSANLLVTCYDAATPNKWIIPDGVSVNSSTYDVIVTFTSPQTGRCVVNGSGAAVPAGLTFNSRTLPTTSQTGDYTFSQISGLILNSQLTYPSLTVAAGTGLSGGGAVALGASITLNMANTAVTAGVCNTSSQLPLLTIDAQGRITNCTPSAFTGGPGPGGGNTILAGFGLTSSTVGSNQTLAVDRAVFGAQVSVPSTSSTAGIQGDWAVDANYYYACYATNLWKRVAISTW